MSLLDSIAQFQTNPDVALPPLPEPKDDNAAQAVQAISQRPESLEAIAMRVQTLDAELAVLNVRLLQIERKFGIGIRHGA